MHQIGELIKKLDIDATRLFNLGETSMSLGTDIPGATRKTVLVPDGSRCRVQTASFESSLSRVT